MQLRLGREARRLYRCHQALPVGRAAPRLSAPVHSEAQRRHSKGLRHEHLRLSQSLVNRKSRHGGPYQRVRPERRDSCNCCMAADSYRWRYLSDPTSIQAHFQQDLRAPISRFRRPPIPLGQASSLPPRPRNSCSRTRQRTRRIRGAPWVLALLVASRGRIIPLRLRRKPSSVPNAEGLGLEPIHAVDW